MFNDLYTYASNELFNFKEFVFRVSGDSIEGVRKAGVVAKDVIVAGMELGWGYALKPAGQLYIKQV